MKGWLFLLFVITSLVTVSVHFAGDPTADLIATIVCVIVIFIVGQIFLAGEDEDNKKDK